MVVMVVVGAVKGMGGVREEQEEGSSEVGGGPSKPRPTCWRARGRGSGEGTGMYQIGTYYRIPRVTALP